MNAGASRITARFKSLVQDGRAGLVTFITAGDPDRETSEAILKGLPEAGADLIEIGMPFSDPMADGPAIQASSLRALKTGHDMAATLELVRGFRRGDNDTPVVLMGYYNPIYIYGTKAFVAEAAQAGVDGLIVVDMPPEEDEELRLPATTAGIDFIRLTTPTSDEQRLPVLMEAAGGFVYYVSVTGITGTKSAASGAVDSALDRLRRFTSLPIAVGFGIKTPEQAAEVARTADAAVVGSAIVQRIADAATSGAKNSPNLVADVLQFVSALSGGVRDARKESVKETANR